MVVYRPIESSSSRQRRQSLCGYWDQRGTKDWRRASMN